MLVYENERSAPGNYLYCQRDTDLCFPAHLHHSLECLFVQQGCMRCFVEREEYVLWAGDALIALPDQIHGFETIDGSRSVLWVFSEDWVPEFMACVGADRFKDPVFKLSSTALSEYLDPDANRCRKALGLYMICDAALSQCRLIPRESGDDIHLAARIVNYMQEGYTRDITLKQMAHDLGYNHSYLSSFLNQNLHTSFCELLNHYRIDCAERLLISTDLPMAEIAGSSGFGTIRSFNRIFAEYKKMTPSQYRRQEK